MHKCVDIFQPWLEKWRELPGIKIALFTGSDCSLDTSNLVRNAVFGSFYFKLYHLLPKCIFTQQEMAEPRIYNINTPRIRKNGDSDYGCWKGIVNMLAHVCPFHTPTPNPKILYEYFIVKFSNEHP